MDMNAALSLPMALPAAVPQAKQDSAGKEPETPVMKEYFTDIDGNQVISYEVTPDGQVKEGTGDSASSPSPYGMMGTIGSVGNFMLNNRLTRGVKQFIAPDNMPGSVSEDYARVRSWNFLQSVAWNAANYASGAAMAIALGLNPIWGGAAMATYNLIKDKLSLFIGFASTTAVPAIDRNPRPWMIAGEVLDQAGILTESATALTAGIPGALLPIGLAGCVLRTISGNVKGPSMANIEPRQARTGNLTDVQKKNSNQNVIANLVGSAASLYAIHFLGTAGLGAMAPAIVAGLAGAVAIGSAIGMVKSMDFHPVNEKALRRIIESIESDTKIVGPDRSIWNAITSLGHRDTIVLGDRKLKPTPDNIAHIKELKNLYRGRNYLLDVQDGKITVYLNKGCTAEDRMLATMQGIYAERLREGMPYRKVLEEEGASGADRWLMKESLMKTPSDPTPMLRDLKKAGWSVDVLKSHDEGKRATWGGGPDESGLQYELELSEPPPKPGTR